MLKERKRKREKKRESLVYLKQRAYTVTELVGFYTFLLLSIVLQYNTEPFLCSHKLAVKLYVNVCKLDAV